MKKRVVITGIGVISPIGTGRDVFWKALLEGKNGIERITRFDPTELSAQIAGEVKDFEPEKYIDKKEAKRILTADDSRYPSGFRPVQCDPYS